VLIHRPGSVQSSIHIGRPAVPATAVEFIPLQLAGAVFGGSFSSRLMQKLREEKGYTYGAHGGLDALRAGGRLSASADVRNEVTGAALEELLREYTRMGSEPVPERELEDVKRYLVGGYLINSQMQSALASSLAANWQVGLPAEFLSQYAPAISAVDSAQVQAIGRRFFDPKSVSIVVVGDPGVVARQLAEQGAFEELE
jgi:zinc protease